MAKQLVKGPMPNSDQDMPSKLDKLAKGFKPVVTKGAKRPSVKPGKIQGLARGGVVRGGKKGC